MDRGWDTASFTLSDAFVKKPNNSELEGSVILMERSNWRAPEYAPHAA
jgi:hypothetical protein